MTNRFFASRTPLFTALALTSLLGACVKVDPVALDRDSETDAPVADVPVVDAPTTDAPLPDAPADSPPTDSPPTDTPPDAPGPAVCPADLYVDGQGSVPTLAYPGVILEEGAADSFDGVWLAPERAAPAVTQSCNARFVTSPPSLPCTADARVRITNTSRGGTFSSVVGVPFEWLAAVAPNTEVHVVRRAPDSSAPAGTRGTLLVTRLSDAKLLLMVTDDARNPSGDAAIVVPNAEITVRPDVANPVCTAAPGGFCSYVFSQLALSLSTPEGPMRLLPGASADVHTSLSGDFHVLHRRYIRRGGDGVSCAFLMPDKFSFAVVRTN